MKKKTAFLFSGQGAQYPGMGKELYERYAEFEAVFNYAAQVLGKNIQELCFKGSMAELSLTRNTQLAIFVMEVAVLSVLQKYGIKPDAVAGYSVGEYSALYAGSVFDLMTALYLVNQRALAMDKAADVAACGMAAISGDDIGKIEELCAKHQDVWVSNYNSHKQVSISGVKESVRNVMREASELSYLVTEIKVSGAFHTLLMKNAAEEYEQSIKLVRAQRPRLPIVLNVTGEYYRPEDKIEEIIVRQIYSPVKWQDTIEKMLEDNITDFIEIGPGKVLSRFVKDSRGHRAANIFHVEDMKSLAETIDGIFN